MSKDLYTVDGKCQIETVRMRVAIPPGAQRATTEVLKRIVDCETTYREEFAAYAMKLAEARGALKAFEDCVRNSGGVVEDRSGRITGCRASREWLDLAVVYMHACEVLQMIPAISHE